MENQIFTASYHRYGSQEQLVTEMNDNDEEDDDFDEEEDDEDLEHAYDFVQVAASPKHIHFVTDASLSSWSDPEAALETSTRLG